MGPRDRGVDRDDPVEVAFGIGLGEQCGEDLLPGAVGGPLPQAVGTLPAYQVNAQAQPATSGRVPSTSPGDLPPAKPSQGIPILLSCRTRLGLVPPHLTAHLGLVPRG